MKYKVFRIVVILIFTPVLFSLLLLLNLSMALVLSLVEYRNFILGKYAKLEIQE